MLARDQIFLKREGLGDRRFARASARPGLDSYLRSRRHPEARRFLRTQMRQPDGERIRFVRSGRFGQAKERADHERDLALVGPAAPDRCLLDPLRRIFEDRQATFSRREDGCTASRAENDRGLVALHVNDRFQRATIRLVRVNQFRQSIMNCDQAGGGAQGGRIRDRPGMQRRGTGCPQRR